MSRASFPNMYVHESKKDEDYHLQYHDAVLGSGHLSIHNWAKIRENYEWFYGTYKQETTYHDLLIADNGARFPINHIPTRELAGYIEWMLGDMASRPFKAEGRAISPTAISRKVDGLLNIEARHKLMPLWDELQQMTGFPIIREDDPMNKEDLEEKKKNYKEMGEVVKTRMLNDFETRTNFSQMLIKQAEMVKVAGICHLGIEKVNGWHQPRHYRPEEVLVDSRCISPLFRDEEYKAIVRYESLAHLSQKYKLTKEEQKKLRSSNKSMAIAAFEGSDQYLPHRSTALQDHVLVTRVYWLDVNPMEGHTYKKKDKKIHKMYPKDFEGKFKKQRPDEKVDVPVETIRYCVVLGGTIVKEFGVYKDQEITYNDTWNKARFPIISFCPRFNEGHMTSDVDLAKPVEAMMNRSMIQIVKAMKKDRGVSTIYDEAQLPEKMKLEDVSFYGELLGLTPINSGKFAVNSNFNQWSVLDQSMKTSIQIYLNIYANCQDMMSRILGLPDARMGFTAGQERVGVVNNAREQSLIRSNWFYTSFNSFVTRYLQAIMRMQAKDMAEDPEKFAHIVGHDGMRFLQQNPDWPMEDYAVHIVGNYDDPDQLALVREMVMKAVHQQNFNPATALRIMFRKNPQEAQEELDREMARQQRMTQEQMQQQMEMQERQAQQQMQMQQQQQVSQQENDRTMLELKAFLEHQQNKALQKQKAEAAMELQGLKGNQQMKQARIQANFARDKAIFDGMLKAQDRQIKRDNAVA